MDDNLETLPVVSVQTQRTYWMTDTGKHCDIKGLEKFRAHQTLNYGDSSSPSLPFLLAIPGMQQSTFLLKSTGLNEHERMIAH